MAEALWYSLRSSWRKLSLGLAEFGDFIYFSYQSIIPEARLPSSRFFLPICYRVGVQSVPVVAITGMFIGMVLAVQAYGQFNALGMATQLGHIINVSVVKELGPVLAAVMLAGRVGSAMAAEIATMKVTEQIEALRCLGVNPLHHLVRPRFLACVMLIPALTVLANFMGVFGGSLVCTHIFSIDPYHYWQNSKGHISTYDVVTGLIKPLFFGAAISLISCHRGMFARAGAEGVGRAATSAFVLSFVSILVLDFFIALFLNDLHTFLWPGSVVKAFGPK